MSIPKKVLTHLEKSNTQHEVVDHKTVFTVYDLSQTLKEKMQNIAKSLLIKVDKEYKIVVIPSHYRLDLGKLKKFLNAKKISIAKEKEMQTKFKVKPGGLSAFGGVYKVGVVADASLAKIQKAIFHAGSFTQSVRMKVKDYMKLEDPITGRFVVKPVKAKPKKKK
ncbi:YbaK/EbsC family protein [Patescibacteria group bacterium]